MYIQCLPSKLKEEVLILKKSIPLCIYKLVRPLHSNVKTKQIDPFWTKINEIIGFNPETLNQPWVLCVPDGIIKYFLMPVMRKLHKWPFFISQLTIWNFCTEDLCPKLFCAENDISECYPSHFGKNYVSCSRTAATYTGSN